MKNQKVKTPFGTGTVTSMLRSTMGLYLEVYLDAPLVLHPMLPEDKPFETRFVVVSRNMARILPEEKPAVPRAKEQFLQMQQAAIEEGLSPYWFK